MTEDVARFVSPPGDRDDNEQAPRLPRPPGWHLCDDDLSVIDALHAVCVNWLTFARDAKSAREVAAMMEALEAIAVGRPVAAMIEVSVSRKPVGGDGLMAIIQLDPSAIELSTAELVWVAPEQGHDHAHTTRAKLSPRGGFDYESVDLWLYLSEAATDGAQTMLFTTLQWLESAT